MHQGQICMSVERVIVHRAVAEEFTAKFVANTKKLKVGNPRELGNCIGPIINQRQLDKIRDQVDDAVAKGAKVLCGGKHQGLFFEPTILTNITRDTIKRVTGREGTVTCRFTHVYPDGPCLYFTFGGILDKRRTAGGHHIHRTRRRGALRPTPLRPVRDRS